MLFYIENSSSQKYGGIKLKREKIMKIIELKESKKVNYFGFIIIIPWFANYLAVDQDGTLNAFQNKPELNEEGFFWWTDPTCEQFQQVAVVDLEGMNWKETLIKV